MEEINQQLQRLGKLGAQQVIPQGPLLIENPVVGKVAVVSNYRLPRFWKTKPDLWFAQIEATFSKKNIRSDKTKYDSVVEALDEAAISEVSDIIMHPPDANLYTNLKTNLIKRFTNSSERQLHRLLAETELGDIKLSRLLRHRRDLPNNKAFDDVLRGRWLDLIPGSVRNILKVSKEDSLTGLADVADTIMENYHGTTVNGYQRRKGFYQAHQVTPTKHSRG